jgi:hypothetical protein
MYTDMNLNNSLEAPTNTTQIKNAKHREKMRTTQPTNRSEPANMLLEFWIRSECMPFDSGAW